MHRTPVQGGVVVYPGMGVRVHGRSVVGARGMGPGPVKTQNPLETKAKPGKVVKIRKSGQNPEIELFLRK